LNPPALKKNAVPTVPLGGVTVRVPFRVGVLPPPKCRLMRLHAGVAKIASTAMTTTARPRTGTSVV
jgi:hypothetical protein